MDPLIWSRIHTKKSWCRKTGLAEFKRVSGSGPGFTIQIWIQGGQTTTKRQKLKNEKSEMSCFEGLHVLYIEDEA
jgi:hypothetical protein